MSEKTQQLTSAEQSGVGQVLVDRFELLALLGEGGQARVYKAHDRILDITVAIKLIPQANVLSSNAIENLRNEVLMARQLNHNHIVNVYEFYQTAHLVFYTMAFVNGTPLQTALSNKPDQNDAAQWITQLVDALKTCHDNDIIHGDIKLDNILIDTSGRLVLLDFGISKYLTAPHQEQGSITWIAPEVRKHRQISAASDLYSLGKVIEAICSTMTHSDRSWRRKMSSLSVALQAIDPAQRPPLAQVRKELDTSISHNPQGRVLVGVAVLVACLIGGIWLNETDSDFTISESTQTDQLKTITIITDYQQPSMVDFARLIHLGLQSHSSVYSIDPQQVRLVEENLGLSPLSDTSDRARITQLLESEFLLIIERYKLEQDNVIRISLRGMPGERDWFTQTYSLAEYRLSDIIEPVLQNITEVLQDDPISAPLNSAASFDLQELQKAFREDSEKAIEEQLLALQTSSKTQPEVWYYVAQIALDFDASTIASDALSRLIESPTINNLWLLRGQALLAQLNDDYETAAARLDALLERTEPRPDLLAERANLAFLMNDLTQAKNLYQQALEVDANQPYWWFELARIKIIQSETKSAIENELTQSLVRFRQLQDDYGQGLVLNAFGVAHLRMSEFSTAGRYFTESLEFRDATTHPRDRATTLANLATVRAIEANYQEADDLLREARTVLEQLNDKLAIAHIENERGLLLEEQGLYVAALKHYKTSLDIRLQESDDYLQAQSVNNVAFMHFLLGDFSLAEVYWRQAIQVFNEVKDLATLHSTQLSYTQLLLLRGQYRQAEQILVDILQNKERTPEAEIATYLLLSRLQFAQSQLKVARQHIDDAIASARQIDDSRGLVEALLWAAEMSIDLADKESAEPFVAELMQLSKQLNHEQRIAQQWLQARLNHIENTQEKGPLEDVLTRLLDGPYSQVLKARIAADIISRIGIPTTHPAWDFLADFVSPTMYATRMDYLIALIHQDDTALAELLMLLKRYPLYWRNAEYYQRISTHSERAILETAAMEAQQRLFEQMTDGQQQQYQNFLRQQ